MHFLRVTLAVATTLAPMQAMAVEGGSGAYLLGSHDLMAGFLPPPGTYVANEFVVISGSAPLLSIGGVAVVDPNIDASVYKLSATHVFETTVLGGHFAINFQMPVADVELSASPDILSKGLEFSDTDELRQTRSGEQRETECL